MRLIFINHVHPETPHVSATRMREFARACAAAGHQVVLLTETLPGKASTLPPAALPAAFDRHDWRMPFPLACAPVPDRLVVRLREGKIAAPIRKPLIAATYLARAGMFTDWRDGSRPYWAALASAFRPDTIWATFGNTDAWVIAQGIARLSGSRWVMDLKDPWSVFIPALLRKILASRFTDFAGATALSYQHAKDTERWFGCRPTVIYSGIENVFLRAPAPVPLQDPRQILVVGGLYADNHLAALVDGIARWATGGEIVAYAGNERVRFLAAARKLADRVRLETPGYLDLGGLRAVAADSAALLYVRHPRALYQHKLIELLALERPVLSLPGESAEAHAIADKLGARLISCTDAAALAVGLTEATATGLTFIDRRRLAGYTWTAQAARLLSVLENSA